MRAVMDASQSFSGLVGATIALAVGVSMVEFSCTAGFPVIWTKHPRGTKNQRGCFYPTSNHLYGDLSNG